jgi:hypothetical protein
MSIRSFLNRELFCRCGLGILALLGCIGFGRGAEATTIYTYSFIQTDYTFGSAAGNLVVAGSFTGTADSFGHITQDTLTDFHVTFDSFVLGTGGVFYSPYSGLPDYFSFLVGDGGGTLSFKSPLPAPFSDICVGGAVAVLCNGGAARGVARFPTFAFSTTDTGPVMTLLSAVSSPPVATTPIPGSLLLLGTALGGLGAVRTWRRKPAAA